MTDDDEFWSMPVGESIYTHAPEPRTLTTGSAYQRTTEKGRKRQRVRKIGFRPPAHTGVGVHGYVKPEPDTFTE